MSIHTVTKVFRWKADIINVEIRFYFKFALDTIGINIAKYIRVGTIPHAARFMASLQLWPTSVLEPNGVSLSLGCVDQLFVAIVEAEIDERFYLDERVEPAVIHAKSD